MKDRSTRERFEAQMRLRNSTGRLRRLQAELKRYGHRPGDSYWVAMHRDFFDRLRFDKRVAKGEI